jgi:hypothetical protein
MKYEEKSSVEEPKIFLSPLAPAPALDSFIRYPEN